MEAVRPNSEALIQLTFHALNAAISKLIIHEHVNVLLLK